MRVLDTHTGKFKDIDPKDRKIKYAILSHTWGPDGEQTYQKLRKIQKRYAPSDDSSSDEDDSSPQQSHVQTHPSPTSDEPLFNPIWNDRKLSPKIREACRVARKNGYDYLWIDSCCIDKTSSSELSESINSMYQWYARADVCYAFLPDVPAEEDHREEGSHFRRSRWFKRGWTLQELIAPYDVQFLSMEWTFIGSKDNLGDLVVDITGIQYNALLNIEPPDEFSVAQRFSWASNRETTREEDRAYSLLGIFDINMPTLYGEGARAFRRLQEEIMRQTPDQSLFAWTEFPTLDLTPPPDGPDISDALVELEQDKIPFLVPFCNAYVGSMGIRALSHDEFAHRLQLQPNDLPARRYEFTPYGICVQLPVISFSHYLPPGRIDNWTDIPLSQWYLVILGCGHKNFPGHLLARICHTQSSVSSIEFLHPGGIHIGPYFADLLPLSPTAITRFHSSGGQISIKTLYIPQPKGSDTGKRTLAREKRHDTIKLVLSEKAREALSAQRYTATLRIPDDACPRTHSITLSHDTHTITIDYQHTLEERANRSQQLTIAAYVKMSGPVRQDAPGHLRGLQADHSGMQVSWRSSSFLGWDIELGVQNIELTDIPGRSTTLTMKLGLTFAKPNHYLLHIELKTADPVPAHTPVAEIQGALDGWPGSQLICPVRAVGKMENVDTGAVAARDSIPGPGSSGGHG